MLFLWVAKHSAVAALPHGGQYEQLQFHHRSEPDSPLFRKERGRALHAEGRFGPQAGVSSDGVDDERYMASYSAVNPDQCNEAGGRACRNHPVLRSRGFSGGRLRISLWGRTIVRPYSRPYLDWITISATITPLPSTDSASGNEEGG
jgi:hypothetical protein